MKLLTNEEKPKVLKKLDIIHRNLKMYDRYEAQLLTLDGVSETMKETANKLPYLRKDKAREVYTIIKKYGWLSREELGEYYNIVFDAIKYADLDILLSILPFARKALTLNKISEEEFNQILDQINTFKTEIENESKTLN